MMLVNTILTAILISVNFEVLLPLKLTNRQDISKIQLTNIGGFGTLRKPRPNIPAHYHTGIDLMRPNRNYTNEPIYPIARGKVISERYDGPYANIIIEHEIDGVKVWTLYEHISGIIARVGDQVSPNSPIARFMNKAELDKNGWQFDHFHLEILKVKPIPLKPIDKYPERFFNSYSLVCYKLEDLSRYYFDPLMFFKRYL